MRDGQERWRRKAVPMGKERFLKELHQVAPRLFAGDDHRPDAFTPIAALFATRASK